MKLNGDLCFSVGAIVLIALMIVGFIWGVIIPDVHHTNNLARKYGHTPKCITAWDGCNEASHAYYGIK